MDLLSNINELPDELKRIIKTFIPNIVSLFLTKKMYIKHHCHVRKYMIDRGISYDNYVRDMIRKDNDFVFSLILKENKDYWSKQKKYMYKNTIYYNYNYFLLEYCIENKKTHCKNCIRQIVFDTTGLCKNQHKKNIRRNVIWTN
jgi:hypothetical protein